MKKVIAVALALVMALSLGISAFAAMYEVTEVDNSSESPTFATPLEENLVYIKPYDTHVAAGNTYKLPITMRCRSVDLQGVESGTVYIAFGIALGAQYKIDENGQAIIGEGGNPVVVGEPYFNIDFPEADYIPEDFMTVDCFEYSDYVKGLADFEPVDMYSAGDCLWVCFSTTDLTVLSQTDAALGYVTVDCLETYPGGICLPVMTNGADLYMEASAGILPFGDDAVEPGTQVAVVADDGTVVSVNSSALSAQLANRLVWDPAEEPSWQDKLLTWLKDLGLSVIGFFITILEVLEGLLATV